MTGTMMFYNPNAGRIQEKKERIRWQHIGALALWLLLMPPMGLWKLWQDPTLSAPAKWRVLVYLFILPALAYVTVSIWTANSTVQRMLP
jgi:hypothetical protein